VPAPLTLVALACGSLAALILVTYLFWRPALTGAVKVWLLLGLGVFPIGLAATGNVQGYERTKERGFCGSCHVMGPYEADSNDGKSASLASRHARNRLFGDENCYVCHADYGMYGTVVTKLGGLEHVRKYFTEYRSMPLAEAREKIHLYRPFSNSSCMECHSTELAIWQKTADHRASLQDVRDGRISCASAGCHGYAHPFSKPAGSSGESPPRPEGRLP
jgi:hypothetical protein